MLLELYVQNGFAPTLLKGTLKLIHRLVMIRNRKVVDEVRQNSGCKIIIGIIS